MGALVTIDTGAPTIFSLIHMARSAILTSMSKRRIERTVISLIIIAASVVTYYLQSHPSAQPAQAPAQAEQQTAQTAAAVEQPGYYAVTSVADGDTIEVAMSGKKEKIRLIGVDTPESVKPNSAVQCYAHEASDFTKKNLSGQSVRLEADPIGDSRDRYDRLLRYVYLQDGTLWNQKLVNDGYGFAYLSFDFSKSNDFAAAQEHAKSGKLGLWNICQTFQQSGGRWQTNDIK